MPRRPTRPTARLATRVALGVAAGVVAGLACGTLARALMRFVAVVSGDESSFSWVGTAFIVGLFVVAAVPGAVLAAVHHGRGRSVLLVVMSLLLCVPATSVAREDLSSVSGLSTAQWAWVTLGTVAIYGVVLAIPWVVLRLLRAWTGAQSPRTRPRSALVSPR